MKKYTNDSVNLLALIDEYGFSRSMAALSREFNLKNDTIHYQERTEKAFKEILEMIKDLEERGKL